MTWTADDEMVLKKLKRNAKSNDAKLVLAINKVDYIKEKEELFPYLDELAKKS